MTYVAVAALAVAFAAVATSGGLIRSMIRQQARERETLLNKLMHLAGRTWEPPPAAEPPPPEPVEEFYVDPSQLPDPY